MKPLVDAKQLKGFIKSPSELGKMVSGHVGRRGAQRLKGWNEEGVEDGGVL